MVPLEGEVVRRTLGPLIFSNVKGKKDRRFKIFSC